MQTHAEGFARVAARPHVCFIFAVGLAQDMHSEPTALLPPCRRRFCGGSLPAACTLPWGLVFNTLLPEGFATISISANESQSADALKQGLYTMRYDCDAKVATRF